MPVALGGRNVLALDAALLLVGAVATLALAGVFGLDASAPTKLWGDHLFTVTAAKSYIEGHGFRLNPSLGFPDVQDYLYFPSFDGAQRILLWLCAVTTRRPFVAVEFYYALGLALTYGATVWSLRWLGVGRGMAAAAAVAYCVSPYFLYRAFAHDFLAMVWAAPMGLALAFRLAVAPPPPKLAAFLREPFVACAMIASAASGVYYAFFAMLFLAFAATAAGVSQRRWAPVRIGAAMVGLMLAILLICGFGLDLPTLLHPTHAQVARAPLEQLIYGLDLAGMALALDLAPHAHAALAQAQAIVPDAFGSEGAGRFPGALLTAILAISPIIAACAPSVFRRGELEHDRRARLIGFAALCATFGLLYAARGGLGFLFNLEISAQIRSTARIMPFLAFCALVIAVTAAELAPGRLRLIALPLVAALLLLSGLPVMGGLATLQQAQFREPYQAALRESLPRMIAAKTRAGALRVLELPVWWWPEAPTPRGDVDQYSPQLPYIYDTAGSGTRWSYGAAQNQGDFARRQAMLTDPAGMPVRARAYGYDAILVQKHAYGVGAPEVEAALGAQLRPACRVYDDATFALFVLSGACTTPP